MMVVGDSVWVADVVWVVVLWWWMMDGGGGG